MTRTKARQQPPTNPRVRCAIYTRKSTEEGLDQEYNTLDAQRDSGEAYIRSQTHEGWECLSDRYDDGGFTGGNMDRPALRRLMADIEAGKVDCVVVYKVDRLSRSLLDFARMMEVFEKHHVSFVSVTQQFNTSTSMGRLVLNVLLSFAQFEREMISERTRDKIAATRRKGKWSGGCRSWATMWIRGARLIVNEDEAIRVRAIFELYLEHQALLMVIGELDRRGWVNKRWTTRKGHDRGGKQFNKASLYKLLTNVTYIGKLAYKDEVHDGEHSAIVRNDVWQRVQALLQRNGRTGGASVRNNFRSHCSKGFCGASPATAPCRQHTPRAKQEHPLSLLRLHQRPETRLDNRPSKSIPAPEIERFVVDQIKSHRPRPCAPLNETVAQAKIRAVACAELEVNRRGLERELGGGMARFGNFSTTLPQRRQHAGHGPVGGSFRSEFGSRQCRATEVREQVIALSHKPVERARGRQGHVGVRSGVASCCAGGAGPRDSTTG